MVPEQLRELGRTTPSAGDDPRRAGRDLVNLSGSTPCMEVPVEEVRRIVAELTRDGNGEQ